LFGILARSPAYPQFDGDLMAAQSFYVTPETNIQVGAFTSFIGSPAAQPALDIKIPPGSIFLSKSRSLTRVNATFRVKEGMLFGIVSRIGNRRTMFQKNIYLLS
jgi:hypothetical protein